MFCRFTGCNLWSGLEKNRSEAVCKFCDTDFIGTDGNLGGKYKDALSLVKAIRSIWPDKAQSVFVVLTGGEPMLQVDDDLIGKMHEAGFYVSIETNGTLEVLSAIDWITVSPKADAKLIQTSGDELKLVFPQKLSPPESFINLSFDHFYLQPMDGPVDYVQKTLRYCMAHPQWKLSLQMHKILGIE